MTSYTRPGEEISSVKMLACFKPSRFVIFFYFLAVIECLSNPDNIVIESSDSHSLVEKDFSHLLQSVEYWKRLDESGFLKSSDSESVEMTVIKSIIKRINSTKELVTNQKLRVLVYPRFKIDRIYADMELEAIKCLNMSVGVLLGHHSDLPPNANLRDKLDKAGNLMDEFIEYAQSLREFGTKK